MAKAISVKQLEKVRSGHTLWYVQMDQFLNPTIRSFTPLGKKVTNYEYKEEFPNKGFVSKNLEARTGNVFFATFPIENIKLFFKKKAAEAFLGDMKKGITLVTGVATVVFRIRKKPEVEITLLSK